MKHRLCLAGAGILVFAALVSWPAQGQNAKLAKKTKGWTLDEALAQLHLHPHDPYLQYVTLQLARRENKLEEVSGKVESLVRGEGWGSGRRTQVDLFSLFTGALAVQESLQLDTMRDQRPGQRAVDPLDALLDDSDLPVVEDAETAGVKLPTKVVTGYKTIQVAVPVTENGKTVMKTVSRQVPEKQTVEVKLTVEERKKYEAWEQRRQEREKIVQQRREQRAAAEEKRREEERDLTPDQIAARREKELEARRKAIVAVDKLQGPTVKSHPWLKMLNGRTPAVDPLAKLVPDDFYFVQFRSVNKLMDLADNSDLWATHLVSQAYREARTHNTGERLRKQLAVETNPLVQPFYDLAVEEVAVTGSDLFLREGADVTLVFRVKQPALFKGTMDGFLSNVEQARQDAKRTSHVYLGINYEQLTTPDRDVHVFSAYPAEDLHVRSNSLAAFQRVLEAIGGRTADGQAVKRLGDSPEFAYIRTLYARGAREEDGLIYLSDPFIRRLVGPQLKLTERRRMLCYNHLRMIGHGAMLYRTEHGKAPDSLETLHESRCCPQPFHTPKPTADAKKLARLIADLDSDKFKVRQQASAELEKLGPGAEAALRQALQQKPPLEVLRRIEDILLKLDRLCACPSGGAYRLSGDGMLGVCTHHGHAHFLTPNLEKPLAKVRGDEADEYKAFLRDYNQYWRTYFDPIAIRVQATPERYRLETIVLPLIDNSIYTSLAHALGGKPAQLDAGPVPKRNIFSMAVKLNKEALLKDLQAKDIKDFNEELADSLGLPEKELNKLNVVKFLTEGIGAQIGLHLYDAPPNFDFNFPAAMGLLMNFGGRGAFDDISGMAQFLLVGMVGSSLNGPSYLSLPVQDAKIVDAFGDQLETVFAGLARKWDASSAGLYGTDFYRVPFQGDKTKMMRCFGVRLGPVKLRYFWARIGNVVYVASQPVVLEDLLALEKEGAKPPAAASDPSAHALFKIRARNWNEVIPNTYLGWAENQRTACINNQGPLSSVARAFTATLGKIDPKELAILGGRIHREADRLHQAHCFCPEGGHYVLGPDGRAMAMTCSVHGSVLAPRQPATLARDNPLTKQLERFAGMTATLTFLEDGLHAIVIVDRK